jgi:hypothetical protein
LYLAASKGYLAVVRVLLQLGANINQMSNIDLTPLMAASTHKHNEVVKWLVKAGADTQIADWSDTAAEQSRHVGASAEQNAYLEAKTHCSSPGCSGALEGARGRLQAVERKAGSGKGQLKRMYYRLCWDVDD